MKYYSEITKRVYDTEEALLGAEKEYEAKIAEEKKKREERDLEKKRLAEEKEKRWKEIVELRGILKQKEADFYRDYKEFFWSWNW